MCAKRYVKYLRIRHKMFIFCIYNIYNWLFSIFIPVTTLINVSQSLNLAASFISGTNF